ncbi:glutamate receptor ionotropic, kainate glr-3-like [Tachypleus tridentatus]|uniref:glutamate receptor ionotropic, kainate glr-3-like n=1 Tax=Tachypleus tridentatus TaxID=6853 RepID=UPI003FD08C63
MFNLGLATGFLIFVPVGISSLEIVSLVEDCNNDKVDKLYTDLQIWWTRENNSMLATDVYCGKSLEGRLVDISVTGSRERITIMWMTCEKAEDLCRRHDFWKRNPVILMDTLGKCDKNLLPIPRVTVARTLSFVMGLAIDWLKWDNIALIYEPSFASLLPSLPLIQRRSVLFSKVSDDLYTTQEILGVISRGDKVVCLCFQKIQEILSLAFSSRIINRGKEWLIPAFNASLLVDHMQSLDMGRSPRIFIVNVTHQVLANVVMEEICSLYSNYKKCTISPDFGFNIVELTQEGSKLPIMIQMSASGSKRHGINKTNPSMKRTRRLSGQRLKIGARENPPYVSVEQQEGYTLEVVKTMSEILNFTYDLYGGYIGYGPPNWTDKDEAVRYLLGATAYEEIDLAISSIHMSYDRTFYIDYTIPIAKDGHGAMIETLNKQNSGDKFNLALPFEGNVFFVMTVTTTVMVVVLTLTSKAPSEFLLALKNKNLRSLFQNLKYSVFECYGILLIQGNESKPIRFSNRIALWWIWVFSLIMFLSFSTKSTSLKAVTTYHQPFETFEELLENNDYTMTLVKHGFMHKTMWKGNLTTAVKLRKREKDGKIKFVSSFNEGLNVVLNSEEKHVYFSSTYTGIYKVDKDPAFRTITVIGPMIREDGHFVMPKNSPFKEEIVRCLQLMKEAGVTARLWSKLIPQNKPIKVQQQKSEPVNMKEAILPFSIISVSLFLSFGTLVVEFVLVRYRKPLSQPTQPSFSY